MLDGTSLDQRPCLATFRLNGTKTETLCMVLLNKDPLERAIQARCVTLVLHVQL